MITTPLVAHFRRGLYGRNMESIQRWSVTSRTTQVKRAPSALVLDARHRHLDRELGRVAAQRARFERARRLARISMPSLVMR